MMQAGRPTPAARDSAVRRYDTAVVRAMEAFQSALTNSIDVLEFKLNRVCETEDIKGIEGRRRAIDSSEVLAI